MPKGNFTMIILYATSTLLFHADIYTTINTDKHTLTALNENERRKLSRKGLSQICIFFLSCSWELKISEVHRKIFKNENLTQDFGYERHSPQQMFGKGVLLEVLRL